MGHFSVAVAALVATLALVGCGGGGGESSPTAAREQTTPEPPGYAVRADALCRAAQAEQEEIRRERGGVQLTLDDRARLLVDLAPPRVVLGAELGALPPPAGDGDARLGQELAAAARRRGVASTQAGELWAERAPAERIKAAAAAEHDERELFVGIASKLGLTDCAEVLSAADRRAITETIERGLASTSARERCETLGERFLGERYNGAVARCGRNEGPGVRAEGVEILALQGIDEVFATAQVSLAGPDAPDRVRVRIVYEDGAYRIDKLD